MSKQVQKITIKEDTGIFISNIMLDSNCIEYCIMKGNEIMSPKKIVRLHFSKNDMVEFDGIQINKQYLIQLMKERDYTQKDIEEMFIKNS